MTDKIYGLVGCGMMGIEHVQNVNLLPGAQIGVVYDPLPDNAAKAASIAGAATIAKSFEDLISNETLDAVILVSPNQVHVDQLEAIATKRTVPILCEKPLFTEPAHRARIETLRRDYVAPIWVAMEYRYMPPIATLIRDACVITGGVEMLSIKEHRFPFLKKFGNWNRFNRNTGGTFVEKCCHFFDLMRLILDSEAVRVMASASQVTNHREEQYGGEVPDIWDSGYVIVEFETGARAMLELCMFADGSRWNEEISAVGEKGKIECRLPGPQRFWPEEDIGPPPAPQLSIAPRHPKNPQTRDIPITPELAMAGDHHGSTFYQHQRFLEVVRGNAAPEVTLEDGMRAVDIGLAAQEAALAHRVVHL
ncbi:MAG: Gfo/Idh/MocA family oxidoreductase [Pseudomonadota bacterium]